MNFFDYLFENTAGLTKDFVLGGKEKIFYQKLYKDSLQLADLIRAEVGENQNILLISENSVFFIKAYLAIMKSGNVCVPLNPAIEQENLNYIISETKSEHVFIPEKLKLKHDVSGLRNWSESILVDKEVAPEDSFTSQSVEFDEQRIAQILFTSGSTGKPKGVMLNHRNLIANTGSIVQYIGLGRDDIIELVLPFYYCYGLSLLHTHLRVGGSVVLNNHFIFLGTVISDLRKYRCTGFSGVPSHFQILLRKSKSFTKTDFPDLRYVTQAGGKLHDAFIREFVEAFPDKKFFVMYGQTEATARLSWLPPEMVLEKIGSIGKGIPGVTLEVFNEKDEPVKMGDVGEIVARGDNIMTGYLNDPEGNKLTLRNGWLHTGDMAKKDKDGFIFLVARKKEIIKVGGKRISPKEIEEVIVSVPEVVDCTIEGVYDELLGEAIKAIVVLKDGTPENSGRELIIKACTKNLSKFKIPQILEFKSRLDVNEAGKKVAKP
jgi:acyl-CoA synthetase (AMP-forming)/AMP-acid ligase II